MSLRFILWFLPMLFLSCQKPGEDASELKWGHLKTTQYDPAIWLISAPPHSVIQACGMHENYAVTAMQKWAAAVGRSSYLTFATCNTDSRATITVTLQSATCSGTAWADPGTRTINLCNSNHGIAMDQLILHEMGHIWGMCDQYQEGLSFCDTGQMTSSLPAKSVMRWYEVDLQQDDIDGMNALINRSDIAANKVWKDFLASPTGGNTGGGNTGTGTGNTPTTTDSGGLYMAVEDVPGKAAYFYISAPSNILNVRACVGGACSGATQIISFMQDRTTGTRNIFKSVGTVSPVAGTSYVLEGLGSSGTVASSVTVTLYGNN